MTEQEKRLRRVCFTGHRPEKLTRPELLIKQDLKQEIEKALSQGKNVFITGMARGIDLWAAELVLDLRAQNPEVKLICACPYPGMERRWSEQWRQCYRKVLADADYVKYICPAYTPSCFLQRDRWMVDHSALVISVFSGEPGGTKYTMDYAGKKGVPVAVIEG